MRNTQSIILGDGGGEKGVPTNPSVASQAGPTIIPDKVEPLPTSSNGYAQAAAKVNTVNDAVQGRVRPPQSENATYSTPVEVSEHPNIKSLTDFTNEIYKDRMPSEEELAKEQKREKSRMVISAIADGASAISNLYFTSKGATNVEQTSMSSANTKRYQEILDRRRKMQGEWDNARLAAYDRDRGFGYQKDRDDANWERSGRWHEDQVKTDNTRFDHNRKRQETIDAEEKEYRNKNYELNKKGQENQEKAQKDASARGWASVDAQKKRIDAQTEMQEKKQRDYSKYQFEKMNGSPEPKKISEKQSIYVGKNTWEQNSGQIAGEIYKDLLEQDAKLAKEFDKALNGGYGKKSADAKQTAALVDKHIMRSPRAQQLAIDLESDYKKRYELAANGALPQSNEDHYDQYQTKEDPYAKYETKQ